MTDTHVLSVRAGGAPRGATTDAPTGRVRVGNDGPAADSPIHRVPRDVDTVAGPTHHNKGEQR